MLQLAKKIIHAYNTRGLVTAFVYGKYSHGKTSYLLHVTKEVFENLFKLKDVDAWLMALDHLFFNPAHALMSIEVYRAKHPGGRLVVLGLDDCGQHIPRARWWREDVVQFREWMSVARSDVSAIIFTAPTQLSLPGGIIDTCFLRVHVKKHPTRKGMSMAEVYEVSVSPYFQQNVSGPKWEDTFPRHYPNYVFERYEKMREDMIAPLRRSLISKMGLEKTIETLTDMGATQGTIGNIVGLTQQGVSYRKKNKSNKNDR